MKELFDLISKEEKQQLIDTVSYITVLIAGAEENINQEELEWAEKLTKIRTFSHHKSLQAYYETVGLDFHEKLISLIESLPEDLTLRTNYLSDKIAQTDPILQKLPVEFGALLYRSFTSFAKHVAKASGGFLGIGSISSAEAPLIKLPMLTPVIATIEDDEEEDDEYER